MSTVVWCVGFGLMLGSFSFLFGRGREEVGRPNITIDPWWPEPSDRTPSKSE